MIIKFLTLNSWHGGAHYHFFEDIVSFLRKQDADVVFLQETYNGTDPALPIHLRFVQALQERLHYPASHFAPAFKNVLPEGNIEEGNLILSKFPITATGVTFFNEPFNDHYIDKAENYPSCPRNLQHAVLDTPAGEVHAFNFQGVWDLDGDSYSERRRKMSETIINAIREKQRILLAGDTNAKPTNKAMRDIEQYLTSVFGNSLTTSFNIRRKDMEKFPGYGTAVVDLMYVSPDIEILEKACLDVDLSDHLPLVATLRLPAKELTR
jgi:endonuclease/exonuclease/phosphatase family metal-dependent hydrolase